MSTNEPPVEHEADAYRNLRATMQRTENDAIHELRRTVVGNRGVCTCGNWRFGPTMYPSEVLVAHAEHVAPGGESDD